MEKINVLMEEIQENFNTFVKEATSNVNGNKSAGRRARQASLTLTKLFKDYRALSVANDKQ